MRCVLDSLIHISRTGRKKKSSKLKFCMLAISLTVCRVVFGVLFRSFRVILVSFWSDGCTAAVYFASCRFGFFFFALALSVSHVLDVLYYIMCTLCE